MNTISSEKNFPISSEIELRSKVGNMPSVNWDKEKEKPAKARSGEKAFSFSKQIESQVKLDPGQELNAKVEDHTDRQLGKPYPAKWINC